MGELKKVFRPELLNRIDEVIVFHKLTKDEIIEIVDLMMRRVREQMSTHEVAIELSDSAKELLVEKGYDPAMGARPLRRAIQRYIEDPLADFVLSSDLEPGSTIVVDRKDGRRRGGLDHVSGAAQAREGRGAGRRRTTRHLTDEPADDTGRVGRGIGGGRGRRARRHRLVMTFERPDCARSADLAAARGHARQARAAHGGSAR